MSHSAWSRKDLRLKMRHFSLFGSHLPFRERVDASAGGNLVAKCMKWIHWLVDDKVV